jgi:large subunit ribosomal protein L25
MFSLQVEPRSKTLKVKQLRKLGFIPGCLYGDADKSLLLQITQSEAKKLLKSKTKGGNVSLDMEGEKINALLREIGRSPVNGQIVHLSFQKLNGNESIFF